MNAHASTYRGRMQEASVSARLLAWYDAHHRDLPWRVAPREIESGVRPDPYRVWLSEVMLQQTTVEAVRPYFARFTRRWPTIADLAEADNDDVMREWAGLGYYSRARNLKKCADRVAASHDGDFPDTEAALRELPGIGAYTAAAIAAIAFNRPATVVDGNVERVVSRLHRIDTPLPAAKAAIGNLVAAMLPAERPGDFAQAMMDLGATICSPKRPKCMLCPLSDDCAALLAGDPELFPVKAPKRQRPLRHGAAFVAIRGDGSVLLRKRPENGMLGGMTEPPTTDWSASKDGETGIAAAPLNVDWRSAGSIRHIFTHFELMLKIWRADEVSLPAPPGWWWSAPEVISSEALPTVMKKAIAAAIAPEGRQMLRRKNT